jgi:pimeloyl-ACP methyl ester carboxylesterase
VIHVPADGDYGRPVDPAAPKIDWGAHEHDASIGGRRVRYVDVGAGTFGFLCIHGLGGCRRHYSELLPSLARHGRAIALDLPGFGASQTPAQSITLELFADTAAALAREVGLDRVVVIGHSMGGPIALRFANRHPELAVGLILLAGAVETFSTLLALREITRIARERPGDTVAIYTEVLTCGLPMPRALKRAIVEHASLRRFALWPYVHRPELLQPDTVAAILAGAGAREALPTARAIGRSRPYEGLEQIRCPILSIGAAHDRIVPVADLESFDRNAPTAMSVLLEDSGHLVMLERPRAVLEEIDRFIDKPARDGNAGRSSSESQSPSGM